MDFSLADYYFGALKLTDTVVVVQFKKSCSVFGLTKLFLCIYGQPDEMGSDWTHRS